VRKETILVVDDTEDVRKMIRLVLTQHGYRVLEAADGAEALEVSEANNHSIHLLLTDVVMPRMDGGELADRLSRLIPSLRMIFMSGYADHPVVRHVERSTTFLAKPFTSHSLARTVREALDSPGDSQNG
jgi:two-component system cell cycle sensor histidine kinase/response regulator CckA